MPSRWQPSAKQSITRACRGYLPGIDHGKRDRHRSGDRIAFARTGYTMIVTHILEAEGKAVAARIVQQGGAAEFHHHDVTARREATRSSPRSRGRMARSML